MYTAPTKSTASYKAYDICVITAANEHQAQGYREQLQWRKNRDTLPEETEFLVIADPRGKRIGSGGSTIYALYKLLEHFCHTESSIQCRVSNIQHSPYELFKGKRILILHPGIASERASLALHSNQTL